MFFLIRSSFNGYANEIYIKPVLAVITADISKSALRSGYNRDIILP